MKRDPVVLCVKILAGGGRCGKRMNRVIYGGSGYIMPGGTRGKA